MWVVKLGGSLADRGELDHWLDILACYGGGEAVIVPGGGPFADRVREIQGRWGFDDRTAHAMALRAMEQYGLMMTGLRSDLVPASTTAELHRTREQAQVPVWLPVAPVATARDIPASWSVTSDSLAAWLAQKLAAERLVLVKAAELTPATAYVPDLAEHDVVDPAFPDFIAAYRGETWVFHTRQTKLLQQALYSGICHGATRVLAQSPEGPSEAEAGDR